MAVKMFADAAVPISRWFGRPLGAFATSATKTARLTVKIIANVLR